MTTDDQVNSGTEHSGGVGTESLVSRESGFLVGRDLDFAVAECLMGWERIRADSVFAIYRYRKSGTDRTVWAASIPHYSTDIAAARQVQDRIGELNLQAEYVEALQKIVGAGGVWALLNATPEQQCHAGLIARGAMKQ